MKNLTGKVALVTGGSRGIGAATARALAEEGANVAISYVSSAAKAEAVVRELEGKGVGAAAFRADQAEPAQVEGLIAQVVGRFGGLDILVNNAGVAEGGKVDSLDNDRAALDRQYAVNFTAVVTAIRAAAAVMSEGGRIITLGSVIGHRSSFPGLADYPAAKAAVVGYSKGAARDLGPRGITVNVIQAGPVATDMNPANGDSAESQRALTALGRLCRTRRNRGRNRVSREPGCLLRYRLGSGNRWGLRRLKKSSLARRDRFGTGSEAFYAASLKGCEHDSRNEH